MARCVWPALQPPFDGALRDAVAGTHDADVARLATAFFTAATPSERVTAANALADRTIGTRGFFEWDSGPEPVGE
jgi:hypothetical protein